MSRIKIVLDRLIKLHTLFTQAHKTTFLCATKQHYNFAAHGVDGPSARLPAFDPSATEA